MKILIIQPWISYRGSETVSVLQAYYLQQLGHKATIACLYVDNNRLPPLGDKVNYILPPNMISKLLSESKTLFWLFSFPVLLWLVYKNAAVFDLLCPHNLPSPWVAAIVKKVRRKRCVWIAHGVPPRAGFSRSNLDKFVWKLIAEKLDRLLVGQVDQVIAVSDYVASQIEERYGLKAVTIYPPVESAYYTNGKGQAVRKKYNIKSGELVMLHLSFLHKDKRPDISLRTLGEIVKAIPKVRLLFVGEEAEKDVYQKLADNLGVGKYVIFAGFIHPTLLKDYFAACDIVLMPYWQSEGCPVVPLQALLSAKISVVAKGSGVAELIGRYKIGIIRDSCPKSFAEAVLQFKNNRKYWDKVALKGKKIVASKFTSRLFSKRFLQSTYKKYARKET